MRMTALAVCSALALAACGDQSDKAEVAATAAPAAAAAVLSGVDLKQPLRALGTEPFWSVELTGSEMIFSSPEEAGLRAPQPAPVMQGTIAIYESAVQSQEFKVTLTATECSDGMSDRTYPLTAIVKLGDRTLTGCAATVASITGSGEAGAVAEAPAT
ncbi:MAG: hypothetical protein EON89_03490 [Brevundimonas sp.]|nr:MAG: hypothetical protein EON89_03490 [Brevundimonas sp.]